MNQIDARILYGGLGVACFFLYALVQAWRWRRAARWEPPPQIYVPPFDPHPEEEPDFGYGKKSLTWSTGKRKKAVSLDMPLDEVERLEPVQVVLGPPDPGWFNKLVVVAAVVLLLGAVIMAGIYYGIEIEGLI
jgi:hypothetical protein